MSGEDEHEVDQAADSIRRKAFPEDYWEQVKEIIGDTIWDKRVDRVMFLGEDSNDQAMRQTVRDVPVERGHGKAVVDQLLGEVTKETVETGVFNVARGAADIGRRWMVGGGDGCIVPNRCKRPRSHDEM